MTAQPRRVKEQSGDSPPDDAPRTPERPSGVLPPSATGTTGFHAALPQRVHVEAHPTGRRLGILSLTALGIVYGDIGTSPLYTIQTVFNPGDPHPVKVSADSLFGIVSLIFWSVTIIVTVTYVLLVMRADNDGEGGIMALLGLAGVLIGWVIPALIERARDEKRGRPPNTG